MVGCKHGGFDLEDKTAFAAPCAVAASAASHMQKETGLRKFKLDSDFDPLTDVAMVNSGWLR